MSETPSGGSPHYCDPQTSVDQVAAHIRVAAKQMADVIPFRTPQSDAITSICEKRAEAIAAGGLVCLNYAELAAIPFKSNPLDEIPMSGD